MSGFSGAVSHCDCVGGHGELLFQFDDIAPQARRFCKEEHAPTDRGTRCTRHSETARTDQSSRAPKRSAVRCAPGRCQCVAVEPSAEGV